ncbi:MAG TPA: hypothetical protein VFC41_07955 [Anaerovoracaceae bacterium]|nr:hypothetical protein [Anaerovoracaceae bacterium]
MRYVKRDFRDEFFKIMQEEKELKYLNFEDTSQQLYAVCEIHQFPFIIKLLNIRFDECA